VQKEEQEKEKEKERLKKEEAQKLAKSRKPIPDKVEKEHEDVVKNAKDVLGELKAFEGGDVDPIAEYIFSKALDDLVERGAIITFVINIAKTSKGKFTTKLSAAKTIYEPITQKDVFGYANELEFNIATNCAEFTWDDIVFPGDKVNSALKATGNTVLHELTHLVLNQVYKNESLPCKSTGYTAPRRDLTWQAVKELDEHHGLRNVTPKLADIQERFMSYKRADTQEKEILSHLMEIVYAYQGPLNNSPLNNWPLNNSPLNNWYLKTYFTSLGLSKGWELLSDVFPFDREPFLPVLPPPAVKRRPGMLL
jgi:hypothetical protein